MHTHVLITYLQSVQPVKFACGYLRCVTVPLRHGCGSHLPVEDDSQSNADESTPDGCTHLLFGSWLTPDRLRNQIPACSPADGRGKIDDPVFFEVVGRKDRVFSLDGIRAFPIFYASTIRPAGCHLDVGPLFQVDVLSLAHLEENVCIGLYCPGIQSRSVGQLPQGGYQWMRNVSTLRPGYGGSFICAFPYSGSGCGYLFPPIICAGLTHKA